LSLARITPKNQFSMQIDSTDDECATLIDNISISQHIDNIYGDTFKQINGSLEYLHYKHIAKVAIK
jgi:hypothetical protein